MAGVNIDTAGEKAFTLLPNEFIDNHMPKANPAFVLIYIYLLRNQGGEIDTEAMAEIFSMLESDIIRSFKYWDKEGFIKYSRNDDGSMNISFGGAKKKAAGKTKQPIVIPEERNSKPPKYNPIELEMYKNDYAEIGDLFEFAQQTLGKMLSDTELSTLYGLYDWLMLPVDVIKYLLEYCAGNGHRRMKYIETVAIDWVENNIKSIDAAEERVNLFNKDYREILKAMGQSGRNPAPKEIEFMDKWIKTWQMPMELITEACGTTVLKAGKGSFKYADTIIEGWFNAGAKNIDDVKRLDADFKAKTDNAPPQVREMPKRKNRFINYEQHVRDYDDIEKKEQEYLLNKLKGGGNE